MGVDLMMVGVHQMVHQGVHQEVHQEGRPEVWGQRLPPPRVTGRLRPHHPPHHPPHRPRQPRRPHRLHLGLRSLWGMASEGCLSGN